MLLRTHQPTRWKPRAARPRPMRDDRLGAPERRELAGMLHQQFWCWGRDITSGSGNLLIALGMTRHRAPDGRIGGTRYSTADGSRHIWGFAMGGVERGTHWLLERFALLPRVVIAPAGLLKAHGPEALPSTRRAHPTESAARWAWMATTARWIADYERGVQRVAGIAHRRATLKLLESPACDADQIVDRWMRWSERFARFSINAGATGARHGGSAMPAFVRPSRAIFSGSVLGR